MQKFFISFLLFEGLVNSTIKGQSVYIKLKEAISKINKSLPQSVDEYTRVDRAQVLRPDTVLYYATISHVNKTQQSLSRIKQIMETKMLDNIKIQKEFKPYRENKVKLVYRYYDENKVLLFSIFLTPDKYLE